MVYLDLDMRGQARVLFVSGLTGILLPKCPANFCPSPDCPVISSPGLYPVDLRDRDPDLVPAQPPIPSYMSRKSSKWPPGKNRGLMIVIPHREAWRESGPSSLTVKPIFTRKPWIDEK